MHTVSACSVNIHAVIPCSSVNGPGRRMVVFFQGCHRRCIGCFNPNTHALERGIPYFIQDIFDRYLTEEVEGITISGGEPFLQPQGLLRLLRSAGELYGLSSVVYTGYSYEELTVMSECRPSLDFIDVLVDGTYEDKNREKTLLARGSTNQRPHFLTDRYSMDDLYMPGRIELTIENDGVVTETGFGSISLM